MTVDLSGIAAAQDIEGDGAELEWQVNVLDDGSFCLSISAEGEQTDLIFQDLVDLSSWTATVVLEAARAEANPVAGYC